MSGTLRTAENASLSGVSSLGASFNSSAIKVEDIEGYAIQLKWSDGGSPVGTLILQVSNSNLDDANAVWSDDSESSFAIAGNSGNIMFNVSEIQYYMVRLSYTRTSGTATASAVYNTRSRN